MNRSLLLVTTAVLLFTSTCWAKEVKIRGFVTNVNSPTSFEIDDYKITRDLSLLLDIEKDESGDAKAVFNPEDIRVGMELEIKGDFDAATGELKASFIKVFLDDTRRIKRTALVEKLPQLDRTESGGWHGIAFADGQKITIADSTVLTFRQNKGERKEAKAMRREPTDQKSEALSSTSDITLDTFMNYEGTRQP